MTITVNGVAVGGGGGASLPDDPAAVLLDAGAPNTFVVLDETGAGAGIAPADAMAMLFEPIGVSLASATGWTTATDPGGTAQIDTAAEEIDLVCTDGASSYARVGHAPWTTEKMDLRARLKTMVGDGSADDFVQMGVGDALGASVASWIRIRDNDTAVIEQDASTNPTPVTLAGISGGQGWMRLVVDGQVCRGYVGVGVGGAEPTSWTAVGIMARATVRNPWPIVIWQANRSAGHTLTVAVDSIRYTVLQ